MITLVTQTARIANSLSKLPEKGSPLSYSIRTLVKRSKNGSRQHPIKNATHLISWWASILVSIKKAHLQLLPTHHAQNRKNTSNPFSAKATLRILYASPNHSN